MQRYLNDEPVQACPPSAGYRLRKFARRNKGGLAVAAAGAVLPRAAWQRHRLGGARPGGAGRGSRKERQDREAEAARQQGERQAKVAGQVELILGEVDRLEKRAEVARGPSGGAAGRGGRGRRRGRRATAEQVRQRLKDLKFIDRLEEIRMQRPMLHEGLDGHAEASREYARAFRDYGVDVEELAIETSIDRLEARSALAIPVAAALDDWVAVRRLATEKDASGLRRVSEKDRGGWNRLVSIGGAPSIRSRCGTACGPSWGGPPRRRRTNSAGWPTRSTFGRTIQRH